MLSHPRREAHARANWLSVGFDVLRGDKPLAPSRLTTSSVDNEPAGSVASVTAGAMMGFGSVRPATAVDATDAPSGSRRAADRGRGFGRSPPDPRAHLPSRDTSGGSTISRQRPQTAGLLICIENWALPHSPCCFGLYVEGGWGVGGFRLMVVHLVSSPSLSALPRGLELIGVQPTPDHVTIEAELPRMPVCCPQCGFPSRRLHSRHRRSLSDLPWQGRPATIQIAARRFRCINLACGRKTFAQHLRAVAPSLARRATRLGDLATICGFCPRRRGCGEAPPHEFLLRGADR